MIKIAAVIVTYNNTGMLSSLLDELQNQTRRPDEIFVIDNGNTDIAEDLIKKAFPEVRYLRYKENIGSAGGYHEGIRLAIERNSCVWLLDDDVSVNPEALAVLIDSLNTLNNRYRVGAVRSWNKDRAAFPLPQETKSFAWRGTLILKETIEVIGLPRKEYFLYADDAEYALRMQKNEFKIFWIPGSSCVEKRSDDKVNLKVWVFTTQIYAHNAKIYYAFRNQISMYKEYGCWYDYLETFAYALKSMFFLFVSGRKDAKEKITAIKNGIHDGQNGLLGKNSKYS